MANETTAASMPAPIKVVASPTVTSGQFAHHPTQKAMLIMRVGFGLR
jgi:hypothetical protein